MKTKEIASAIIGALVAMPMLGAWPEDPVSGVSGAVTVDTRTQGVGVSAEEETVDTRSYTVDWSNGIILNTKKIVGTMLLLR